MKRQFPIQRLASRTMTNQSAVTSVRRGGAVIIVVLSLLTTLLVLGLFFHSWTSQERATAEFFGNTDALEIDPDPIFDFGLKQVLVSTDESYQNSALYGNRWSMLAHVIGALNGDGTPADIMPYNGRGITVRIRKNLIASTGEIPDWRGGSQDSDNDGHLDITSVVTGSNANFWFDYTGGKDVTSVSDTDATKYLRINFSAAANGGPDFFGNLDAAYFRFAPDAGYTYPDINSLFLAHHDRTTGVLIPSFFRPQYMPDLRGGGNLFSNLYTDSSYKSMVMRPHQSHVNYQAPTQFRYVQPSAPQSALSGDKNRVLEPFLFRIGSGNNLGPLSGPGAAYELDADADGDGVTDSIYMDLDHRIVDLPGGRQVMPLYYWKIEDADGLLNVNVHGDLNRTTTAADFGGLVTSGLPAHSSNLGLSASEINPIWALNINPQPTGNQINSSQLDLLAESHRQMFTSVFGGQTPTAFWGGLGAPYAVNITSSMEFAMLLRGRIDPYASNSASPFRGRWTSANAFNTVANLFASVPGTSGDDDLDGATGTTAMGGAPHNDAWITGFSQPSFVHPLDYVGMAQYPNSDTTKATRQLGGTPASGSPAAWPIYDGNWQLQGSTKTFGVQSIYGMTSGLQTTANNHLTNEPNEVSAEPALRSSFTNKLFDPGEMAGLHLSERDQTSVGTASRLRELLPLNFDAGRGSSLIRSQFTTDSWDRQEFSYIPYQERQWEFTDKYNGTFVARFPPGFGKTDADRLTSRHEMLTAYGTPTTAIWDRDPFRPVLRRLLTSAMGAQNFNTLLSLTADPAAAVLMTGDFSKLNIKGNRYLPQQKLNLNRLLVHFDQRGNPLYRELTPHAEFTSSDSTGGDANKYLYNGSAERPMQHDNLSHAYCWLNDSGAQLSDLDPTLPANGAFLECPLSLVTTDKFAQEAWARYDRQRLARDIYVLLSVVGSVDGVDPTRNPLDGAHAREMAQFAVNCVDALDRDSVITRFEYDSDLSDGWDGTGTTTGVVYGLEAQSLSIAESLLINVLRVPNGTPDRGTTLIQEKDDEDNRFLYIELRNSSPLPVTLQQDSWRLVRVAANGTTAATLAEAEINGSPRAAGGTIGPGENFLIACHDGAARMGGGGIMPSDFYVDYKDGTELETLVPLSTAVVANNSTAPTVVLADLDLAWNGTTPPSHGPFFNITKPMGGGGFTTLVQPNSDTLPEASGVPFDLVLQRKKNLQGRGLNFDHEWVEVDRFQIGPGDWHNFSPTADGQAANITAISGVVSMERRQPLDGKVTVANSSTGLEKHTLSTSDAASYLSATTPHQKNSALTTSDGKFNLFESHFDRDFASTIDLLSIPLYGSTVLTSTTPYDAFLSTRDGGQSAHFSDEGSATGHYTAKVRFQNSGADYPTSPSAMYTNSPPAYVNNWYRFFSFVKTDPMEYQFGDQNIAFKRRQPGKLNINTIRHEAVMAGLIDDKVHLIPFSTLTPGQMTIDQLEIGRNWYDQLRIARDGYDPKLSNITVPGLPGANPFQSESYVETTVTSQVDSTSNTMLRDLPLVRNNNVQKEGFGLFEARPTTDFTVTPTVDPHTAKRLLAKVANLTTNRSHVFIIHAGYDLFEAHQPTSTTVQIGAKADDLPGKRMFLVVDMSRLEEAYDATTGTFDFRKFIIHRQLLP